MCAYDITLLLTALRGLNRVQFSLFLFDGHGDVGGQIAVAIFPFGGRVRCGRAIPVGVIFFAAVASLAGFNYRIAVPPIK